MTYKDIENRRAKGRNHYQENKQYYVDKAHKRRMSMEKFLAAVKSYPCQDCNTTWISYVMELDHLDSSIKVAAVSKLVKDGNWSKLVIEIMKCDLVCSNCHRIRTFNRNNMRT